MIRSMTGFGSASLEQDGRIITVELKSVNHRYLDLGIRMPRHIGFAEDTIRSVLSEKLSRGHIDVFINYRNARKDARKIEIDSALLSAYLDAARFIAAETGLLDDITVSNALKVPDVMTVTEAPEDRNAVISLIADAVNLACDELIGMRVAEGERLKADLATRADTISGLAEMIALRAPEVVVEYRAKLNERLEDLAKGVELDKARLATEVALFADRANIDEEIVRLRSHIIQYRELLKSEEPAGRKLDFIVQEMNREFNTMGSKANNVDIVNCVLVGKSEVEKIREQIQNIE